MGQPPLSRNRVTIQNHNIYLFSDQIEGCTRCVHTGHRRFERANLTHTCWRAEIARPPFKKLKFDAGNLLELTGDVGDPVHRNGARHLDPFP